MSTIVAFSGRKGAGKNTSANMIIGRKLQQLNICKNFRIDSKGRLWISDIRDDIDHAGIFDVTERNTSPALDTFLKENLDKEVKLYSFADSLKQKVCIEVLGLKHQQCYGTDDDKNSVTHLYWENMPGVVADDVFWHKEEDVFVEAGFIYHAPGVMTAREVMQFVGTELFRKMYNNVWVDATLRQIEADNPKIALIADLRFPNEADGVLGANGGIFRFTRAINPNDRHESETALDNYQKFTYIVDNKNMTVAEQNLYVFEILQRLGILE